MWNVLKLLLINLISAASLQLLTICDSSIFFRAIADWSLRYLTMGNSLVVWGLKIGHNVASCEVVDGDRDCCKRPRLREGKSGPMVWRINGNDFHQCKDKRLISNLQAIDAWWKRRNERTIYVLKTFTYIIIKFDEMSLHTCKLS